MEVLNFYTGLIEAGYEPDETTQTAIVDNLSGVTSDDPALQDIIDDAIDTVDGEELNIVSLNDVLVGNEFNVILEGADGRDVFVLDAEMLLGSTDFERPDGYQIIIEDFDPEFDQLVFSNYDGDGNGLLGDDPSSNQFLELASEDPLVGWTVAFGGDVNAVWNYLYFDSAGHNWALYIGSSSQITEPLPSQFSDQPLENEDSPIVFYADEIIFADDLIA